MMVGDREVYYFCEQCGCALGWMGNWQWQDGPQCRDCKWQQGLPRRRGWLTRFRAWRADRRLYVPYSLGPEYVGWRRRLHDGAKVWGGGRYPAGMA